MSERLTTTHRPGFASGAVIGLLLVLLTAEAAAQQRIRLEYEVDFSSLEVPEGTDPEVAREAALRELLTTLRSRLDALGVSQAAAYSNSQRHIVVQLPATEENLAYRQSLNPPPPDLGFHVSHSLAEPYLRALAAHTRGVTYEGGASLRISSADKMARIIEELHAPLTPPALRARDDALLLGSRPDDSGVVMLYMLERDSGLSSDHLTEAYVAHDDPLRPFVVLRFDEVGAEAVCQLTSGHVDQLLAITLDGEVLIAPLVREPICGGEIRLDFGTNDRLYEVFDQANALTTVLRSAALPSPLRLIRDEVVGAEP